MEGKSPQQPTASPVPTRPGMHDAAGCAKAGSYRHTRFGTVCKPACCRRGGEVHLMPRDCRPKSGLHRSDRKLTGRCGIGASGSWSHRTTRRVLSTTRQPLSAMTASLGSSLQRMNWSF